MQWHKIGDMPTPVYGAQVVVHDSVIYILGGISVQSSLPVKKIQAYYPNTNAWKDVAQMNVRRYDFTACNYADSIIYFGGVSSLQNSNTLEVWDFNSNPRIYDTNTNFNRLQAAGAIINGNIYIFGGQTGKLVSYLAIYNISQSKLIQSGNFPNLFPGSQFPADQMSVAIKNNIYLLGGTYSVLLNSIFRYNTDDNSFTKLSGKLDKPRAGGVAVSVNDSLIYIIGGYVEGMMPFRSVEIVNINGNEIESEDGPLLNVPRIDPIVVSYNNSVYVMGGYDQNGQPVSSIEKLDIITGVKNSSPDIPSGFALENNYPNPFNPSTNIAFKVSKTAKVSLDVYSILGQHVRNITSREFSPGEYTFTWNGIDKNGNSVPSGVYIYRINSGYFTDAKKMILMK